MDSLYNSLCLPRLNYCQLMFSYSMDHNRHQASVWVWCVCVYVRRRVCVCISLLCTTSGFISDPSKRRMCLLLNGLSGFISKRYPLSPRMQCCTQRKTNIMYYGLTPNTAHMQILFMELPKSIFCTEIHTHKQLHTHTHIRTHNNN